MGPVRAAWGRGKVDAQASLGRVGPVRAAWGRGKVAWGGVGLSRVEYHGTDAEASLTSGRRPSGVGGLTADDINLGKTMMTIGTLEDALPTGAQTELLFFEKNSLPQSRVSCAKDLLHVLPSPHRPTVG